MSRGHGIWIVYAGCLAAAIAVTASLTAITLRLERAGVEARADSAHRAAVSTALWHMDSWLAPQLAQEAARPWTDYRAYAPQQTAFNANLAQLAPYAVLTPSPLLTYRSELFLLHFQVDEDGRVTSPQVPQGNELDLAQANHPDLRLAGARQLLATISDRLKPERLRQSNRLMAYCLPDINPVSAAELSARVKVAPAWVEFQQRAQNTNPARQAARNTEAPSAADTEPVAVGPLLPLWIVDATADELLLYAREVQVGGRRYFQGLVADWSRLRQELLAQVRDPALRATARLARAEAPGLDQQARMLATVPAVLEASPPAPPAAGWGRTHTVLAIAWLAVAALAVIAALTLRTILAFGDKRARFASAVTHELRTPLTTFRMYSEMLATDMVSDPAQRRRYLETLRAEADRLSRLVENVLGYSRIEDRRFTAQRRTLTLGELWARIREPLERRTIEAGIDLDAAIADPDAALCTDPEAVAQILFNLVDNACKYGRGPVEVRAEASASAIALTVRDHGPGIPARHRRRVFAAFDRGSRGPGDNETPGIGLGLALAAGLAGDLGGRLDLEEGAPGARFILRLPARR